MKLHKLKLKNIASLRGEHLIDFHQIQNQSSLFAITGETGAGKSTILNAIGLALYGRVYKSAINQNDVVTLGEKEGQIELIFQAQGQLYYAFWRAKIRKQNGELYATPQLTRELYEIEDVNFSADKRATSKKAEEILNLNFDQYCKCVILNQGEFSRFLTSSFTERKEILEKLYPGEMLDNISSTIRFELEALKKEQNELIIERNTLMSDGHDPEKLKIDQKEINTKVKALEIDQKQTETASQYFKSIITYHKMHQDTEEKIQKLKLTIGSETEKSNHFLLETKKAQEALNSLQETYAKRAPRLQELIKVEEIVSGLKKNLALENERYTNLIKQKNDLALESERLNTFIKEFDQQKDLIAKGITIHNEHHLRLIEIGPSIIELSGQIKLLESEMNSRREALEKSEQDGKKLIAEKTLLTERLGDSSKLTQKLNELKVIKDKNQILKDSKNRALVIEENVKKAIVEKTQSQKEVEESVKQFNLDLKSLISELAPIEFTIESSYLDEAIGKCLTHVETSNEPECPVCHQELAAAKVPKLKSLLKNIDIEELRKKQKEISKRIHQTESEIESQNKELQKIKASLELLQKELKDNSVVLGQPSVDEAKIEEEFALVQKTLWDQEQFAEQIKKIDSNLQNERQHYGQLKTDLTNKENKKKTLDEKFQGFQNEFSFLDISEKALNELKIQLKLIQDLNTVEQKREKALINREHVSKNTISLDNEINKLTESIENNKIILTKNLKVITDELKDEKASDILKHLNIELTQLNENLRAKQSEEKDQERKLAETRSRIEELKLMAKDTELHFKNESMKLKNLRLSDNHPYFPSTKILFGRLDSLALTLSDTHDLFVPLQDNLLSELSDITTKLNEYKMQLASTLARLADYEKKADRLSIIQLKMDDLKMILDRKDRLSQVLGKDELRSFVLSLVEENLIIQTNEELQKLCNGRYEIIHLFKNTKNPEFYILDKYREAERRKISTLSGGETFMVSLAMALGLAELTRGTAEIDSLFIDEGFGTLDQDSLEDVIYMLKQIQTRGLLVGIISHVKALTHSLPVNLLVSKRTDGTSELKLINN